MNLPVHVLWESARVHSGESYDRASRALLGFEQCDRGTCAIY